jgi:hypothetical protein
MDEVPSCLTSPSATSSRNSVSDNAFEGCVLNFGPHYNTYHVTVLTNSGTENDVFEPNNAKVTPKAHEEKKTKNSKKNPRKPAKGSRLLCHEKV